jgi:hypothetical protein
MESLNPDGDPLKPCEYFDMIAGTSTGRLIAIMLGRLRMSVDDCIDEYKSLSSRVFTKVHHFGVNYRGETQGKFDDEALKEGIRSLLERRVMDRDELFKEAPEAYGCKT